MLVMREDFTAPQKLTGIIQIMGASASICIVIRQFATTILTRQRDSTKSKIHQDYARGNLNFD
jgi:Ser/Thr protein kinase RdoA (MazF antagonist)